MKEVSISTALINYLNRNTHIEIKGGTERETFLEIWMVTVGERIFARSWGMSNRSWFTEFIQQGIGQLRFGDYIVGVKGQQLADEETNLLIDQAYRNKYDKKKYVDEITEPKYRHYTMEFFVL